jgi:hypothetical protein
MRRRRLTLGRMMGLIALVALGFAMTRVDTAPAVSLCVFAGCTWYLAVRRYSEALARRAAEGVEPTPTRKARLAARCALVAALAIGLPDAAFLGGYYGYMAAVRFAFAGTPMANPEITPGQILLGALIGICAAMYVAALMRRGFRSVARKAARISSETRPTAPPWLLEQEPIAERRIAAG